MTKNYLATRKKVFWIASIIVVLLLATHVVAFTQITQYYPNDLGLLTKLPITFWIGLSYLVILLFVGRKSGLLTVFVALLISFYLLGIPVLISENKALFFGGISYYYSYKATDLLSMGYLDFGTLYWWNPISWPGFFIFAGFLSASASLPVTVFVNYFPYLTMALLGILAYKTLRLQLNMASSSFGALWFVASFYTAEQYFSPQGIAYIIYFAFLLLTAKLYFTKKQNIAFPLSVFVLFIGLSTLHLLTSLAAVIGVVAIFVLSRIFPQKRKIVAFYSIATCLLLICIFFAYQALVITQSFSGIAEVLFSQLSHGETHLAAISQGRAATSPALLATMFGSYGIVIINVIIAAIAILITAIGIFLYKKEKAKKELFWIALIIGAGLIGASISYGGEAINRAFILMLLPICYFAAKFFSKKPQMLILPLIIIIFLNIPALYGSSNYSYASTSESIGLVFYARYAPPGVSHFYEPNLAYPGPEVTGTQLNIQIIAGLHSLPNSTLVDYALSQAELIISCNEQQNLYQYFYGVDLLENQSLDNHHNRLYDSTYFQIHSRLGE
jgi:hypothetical protein